MRENCMHGLKRRGLETEPRATAPVPDPTKDLPRNNLRVSGLDGAVQCVAHLYVVLRRALTAVEVLVAQHDVGEMQSMLSTVTCIVGPARGRPTRGVGSTAAGTISLRFPR
ncbi:hypothetical protein EF919_02940 [Streptomyces sp. WAC02707]|nr:hypothetical protein EF919_02940 [Streptomyces sp. WAC02707]